MVYVYHTGNLSGHHLSSSEEKHGLFVKSFMGDFMKKRYSNFFEKLICMGAVILAVIPLLYVAGKSVQVPEEYLTLFFKRPLYLRMMWNSLIITIPVLVGQLLLAPLAAYGFWQCRWKYKEILFYLYMIVMLMPLQLTLVPNYLVANWLGIQNSSLAIILPAMFQPLGVFLIRQQIQDFPQETLEAARLDGASEYRIYRSIVKPNLSSAIAAALILIFIDNWNIVDQAVIFLREPYQQPLSVYLCQILEEQPDIFYAASVFYAVPVLLIFLMGQDYLIQGISMSGVKA